MNEHEHAIEKTLNALGHAEAPEGLEARIAAGLARRARLEPPVFRWRDVLGSSVLAGAWWRGAVAGAAAAMLAVGLVLVALHVAKPRAGAGAASDAAARRATLPVPRSSGQPSATQARAQPCIGVGTMRTTELARGPKPAASPRSNASPSHEAAEEPLTAEERDLVLLARRTDPKQLDILNPEMRAKMDADDMKSFDQFFAPPPAPATAGASE